MTSMKSSLNASAALLAAALAFSSGAFCQAWPTKPVTLLVGSAAGSAPDVYARTVAESLSRLLGQPVIVDNRAGANGNIAAELVAKAPADGYALWAPAQSQMEINPSAYADLRWKLTDFVGVIKGVEAPLVLVTHLGVPAKKLAELASWAKANPGKVSYASFSPGTASHFLGHQLNEQLGLDMTHVPFRGSGPQVQNLVGGHVPLGFSQVQTTLPHIEGGRLVALATTGATRWRQLPATPTMAELGYPQLTATTWFGLVGRAGTPPEILAKLVDAAKKVHSDPGVKKKLENMGFDVPGEVDPTFSTSIRAGAERWARIVRATQFKAAE